MKRKNNLKALPSVVTQPDGTCCQLSALTQEECQEFTRRVAQALNTQLEYYFIQHPEGWNHIF